MWAWSQLVRETDVLWETLWVGVMATASGARSAEEEGRRLDAETAAKMVANLGMGSV